MAVKIITDSASDIINLGVENLTVVPMKISFGEEDYLDGITISHKEFYKKLLETDTLPKTSMINPYSFMEAIDNVKQDGDEVVIITVSSKLSGTYNSAVTASQDHEDVYVVDSENVCVGERVLVEYALSLAKQGISAKKIVEILEDKKKSVCLITLLDTLEYLKKGGRISNTVGLVGEVLSIKPVITVSNGELKILGKARGSKKGSILLTQEIEKCGGIDFEMPLCLAYSGFDDIIIKKYIQDNEQLWEDNADNLTIGTVGATIGTHAGPGAIAVAFFSKK
ncbi:MAG: DegV family protein [Eubacteriales bacterium]|nr:DegV family protein [Eubacteriales bacterium]